MSYFASDDRDTQDALRRRMPRAWPAFFQRFGRLTEIQARALGAILDGRNVVLASATASGKTEAALAPMCEALVPGAGLGVLYVVPTRALCNDLERRLVGPVRSMGLRLAIRTGERPDLDLASPQDVVITTPESFDSLLCRATKVFAATRWVVLDELHLVDGTYRGDQLRVLLSRLESARGHSAPPLRFAALSATLADPEAMAARYFRDAVVVRAPGARELRLELAPDLAEAMRIFKAARRKKALVFCNRRADVESAAAALASHWPRDRLVVHHSSLTRVVRERAESAMRTWPFGLCVATTTLEIGLDLGDVDAVILNGAPPSPSAFAQRVGRACRREDTIYAIGVGATEEERALFTSYAELARRGEVEARAYAPDVSVVVQQLFSMLFASPAGLPLETVRAHLAPLADGLTFDLIASHLESEGFVARRGERIAAAASLMDLGEKGRLHSNIPDGREWRVVDAARGTVLGALMVAAAVGDRIYFGGKPYVVERASGGKLAVRGAEGEARAPSFARRERGAFVRYLPESLREAPRPR